MAIKAAEAGTRPGLTKPQEQAASLVLQAAGAAGIALTTDAAVPARSRTHGNLPGHCAATCCGATPPRQRDRSQLTNRGPQRCRARTAWRAGSGDLEPVTTAVAGRYCGTGRRGAVRWPDAIEIERIVPVWGT